MMVRLIDYLGGNGLQLGLYLTCPGCEFHKLRVRSIDKKHHSLL